MNRTQTDDFLKTPNIFEGLPVILDLQIAFNSMSQAFVSLQANEIEIKI
jgi:hypothetical protein